MDGVSVQCHVVDVETDTSYVLFTQRTLGRGKWERMSKISPLEKLALNQTHAGNSHFVLCTGVVLLRKSKNALAI